MQKLRSAVIGALSVSCICSAIIIAAEPDGGPAPLTAPATVPTTAPSAASPEDAAPEPSTAPAGALDTQPATAPATSPANAPTPPAPSVAQTPPRFVRPASMAASNDPTTRPGATLLTLNFKDASIDAVLQHLSTVAGYVVEEDAPVSGRVTLFSKTPVTPDKAVSLLNSQLKKFDLTAIRVGNVLKVMSREKAIKGEVPVHVGSDPKLIEPSDEIITQVIPLRSVDAIKLKTDLTPLISADASLSANAASNSLIMTDTTANIRRIVEIVSSLDKRDSQENTIRVKQLKNADATAAAKLITDIFKTDAQAQAAGAANVAQQQFFRAFRGGGGPGGGGAAAPSEDRGQTGKVVASADARTNTIVVTGPADTLKVIDDVLAQLDADPITEQGFFIYAVKNGQSADMAQTLNSLFGNNTSSNNSGRSNTSGVNSFGTASSGFSNRSGGGGVGSSSGIGGSSSIGGGNRSNSGGSGGSASTGGTINRSSSNQGGGAVPAGVAASASSLYGQVYVVADTDTNSLLISVASKYESKVKDIIVQLDRPVPQVLIKVLIAEVTHTNSSDFGLDFSVLNSRASGNGQTIVQNLGNAAAQTANGGLAVSILETNLTATLHALADQNKLDVLSRPYILASDNQLASITVGQEVPIITGSQTTDLGTVNNTVTYTQVGIILNVTPHINQEGLVILDVAPEVSQLTNQTVTVSPGVNAPIFDNRSADTRVGIKDGHTIVIGGLMQDTNELDISKIPLLGDIPGLGVLFQRRQVTKVKTELLIFLTPHVALQPEKLRAMSQDELNGLKLVPGAVQPGTFQDHMRGMERGGDPDSKGSLITTQPSVPSKPNNAPFEPALPGTNLHTQDPK